jgi:hypothetical protein
MAIPLAAPLAPAIGKGIKIGLGAAWRYGPILLDMADQFQRSPGLAPRTGRAGSQQRLGELLRDAVAGARVAVATPPPPPLPFNNGPDSWKVPPEIERALRPLLDALQRLWQLWGGVNSRSSKEEEQTWEQANLQTISFDNPVRIQASILATVKSTNIWCPTGESSSSSNTSGIRFAAFNNVLELSFETRGYMGGSSGCGEFQSNPATEARYVIRRESGTTFSQYASLAPLPSDSTLQDITRTVSVYLALIDVNDSPISPPPAFTPGGEVSQPVRIDSFKYLEKGEISTLADPLPVVPNLSPLIGPTSASATSPGGGVAGGSLPAAGGVAVPSNPPANWFGQPSTTPGTLPAPLPSVAPTPAYVPRPVPGPSPTGDPAPAPQTEPQPAQVPGTTPAPPTTAPSVPQPGPVAPPLTLPGTVASPAPTPAPTTAPGTHFPVPGAPPVTANGPAPTLKEMAREMGRQEQKLSQLLQRSSQPDGSPVDLGEILRLLLQLLELLNVLDGGGGYQINSPCNVDEETGLLLDPLVTEWGSTIGLKGALVKRIDALADLLQYQKDLPQPICSRKKPTGDFVTVNFEQITNDLETP